MTANRVVGSLALILVLAGCGLSGSGQGGSAPSRPGASSASSAPARPTFSMASLANPRGTKYLGVEAPGAPQSLSPVRAFAALIGRQPNMVGEYIGFGQPFDSAAISSAWAYGALTYIAWEPYGTSVAAIAAGKENAYIARFARSVRALGLPIALSFGHEMNGNWYPWGTKNATPAQFVVAWRVIHAIFTAVRADNVIWVWNPNVISANPSASLSPYWPGNAYVDWVGITGYFTTSYFDTFTRLFGPTIASIRSFTSKPILIAETSVPTGPLETSTAQSLISGVKQHDVIGLIWFNYDKAGQDWRLGSRPALRTAMATGMAGVPLVKVSQP